MKFTRPTCKFLQVARLDGDMDMVGVVFAVDRMLGDQRLREILRLDGQIE